MLTWELGQTNIELQLKELLLGPLLQIVNTGQIIFATKAETSSGSSVHLLVSSVHLSVSSVHLPVSSVYLPVSSVHLLVSSVHLSVSSVHLSVSSVHLLVSSVHLLVSSVYLPVSSVYLLVPSVHLPVYTVLLLVPSVHLPMSTVLLPVSMVSSESTKNPFPGPTAVGEGKTASPVDGLELPLEGHQVGAWRGRVLIGGGALGRDFGGGALGAGLRRRGARGGTRGRRPIAPPARGPWSPRCARPAQLRPASHRAAGRPSERGPGAGPGQTAGGVSAETLSVAPERRGRRRG
ncbi:hypothetical protein LEMLEM_LOCUS7798 [Lemmus lemmus]